MVIVRGQRDAWRVTRFWVHTTSRRRLLAWHRIAAALEIEPAEIDEFRALIDGEPEGKAAA